MCLELVQAKFPVGSLVMVCREIPKDRDCGPGFTPHMVVQCGKIYKVANVVKSTETSAVINLDNGYNYLPHWLIVHCACPDIAAYGCKCGATQREKIKLQ